LQSTCSEKQELESKPGSNLDPSAAPVDTKPSTTTQNKTKQLDRFSFSSSGSRVLRQIAFTHANLDDKTRHQFVTKTRPFRGIFALVRNGKAKQAKRFSFLTTQLTQWRSAVRARTGLPLSSTTCGRTVTLSPGFVTCFVTSSSSDTVVFQRWHSSGSRFHSAATAGGSLQTALSNARRGPRAIPLLRENARPIKR
jgi:hypothetical protein